MSNQKIRTIFIGTPEFGVPYLKELIKDKRFEVISIITGQDQKIGRKQTLTPNPIKTEAQTNHLPILQPKKILETKKNLENLKPDIIIVIAYRQIIPKEILNLPKYGCLNVHASLLPKYRGAACIQAPILNGDKYSGVTLMRMETGLDTGPILNQNKIELSEDETGQSLHDKLSRFSTKNFNQNIIDYIAGKINPKKQDANQASYVSQLTRQDGEIDWEKKACEIERMIRAFYPWPGTYTYLNSRILKIIKVDQEILKINKYESGKFFLEDQKLCVQCGENALIIKKLQPEGKRIMNSKEFIQGYNAAIV